MRVFLSLAGRFKNAMGEPEEGLASHEALRDTLNNLEEKRHDSSCKRGL